MKIFPAAALIVALSAMSFGSNAMTLAEVDVVCPLDGEHFKTVEAISGTQFGLFLDLKPFGAIAAPWPIAKCPSNGFVIFQRKFSEAEISLLKPYVLSAEYQSLAAMNTNYYLAAQLQRKLNAPIGAIANTLLRATWEARPGEQYEQYAAEALDTYKLLLDQPSVDPKRWATDQLVAGELERRLGKFEQATSRFTMLSTREELTAPNLRSIVDQQMALLATKDSRPTRIQPPKAQPDKSTSPANP